MISRCHAPLTFDQRTIERSPLEIVHQIFDLTEEIAEVPPPGGSREIEKKSRDIPFPISFFVLIVAPIHGRKKCKKTAETGPCIAYAKVFHLIFQCVVIY